MTRTAELRDSETMFVMMVRPRGPASKATLASWIQQVLAHSGQRGSGGSTWSSAASHAAHCGARLEDVLGAADWASTNTFRSFYLQEEPVQRKPILVYRAETSPPRKKCWTKTIAN